MNIKKLIYDIKPPCTQCPYTLGTVHTLQNPCPECRANGYQMFKQFQRNNHSVPAAKDQWQGDQEQNNQQL